MTHIHLAVLHVKRSAISVTCIAQSIVVSLSKIVILNPLLFL